MIVQLVAAPANMVAVFANDDATVFTIPVVCFALVERTLHSGERERDIEPVLFNSGMGCDDPGETSINQLGYSMKAVFRDDSEWCGAALEWVKARATETKQDTGTAKSRS